MPEISRFYGIVVKMYFADHNPPHFHAEYGDEQMIVDLTHWQSSRASFHLGPRGW